MTFTITVFVREGIVMASDSRITLNTTRTVDDKPVQCLAVGQSDNNYKTFLMPNDIGITLFGDASIGSEPISGHVEAFAREKLEPIQASTDLDEGAQVTDQGANVDIGEVPSLLLEYFQRFPEPPDTGFLVAGYKSEDGKRVPYVWRVVVRAKLITRANQLGAPGAVWDGETDVLMRLLNPVWVHTEEGEYQPVQQFGIPWAFFTLQDAIDFAIAAVRTTIETIRFQLRAKTVGGPIDVLVIKPDGAQWIQRKGLHGGV